MIMHGFTATQHWMQIQTIAFNLLRTSVYALDIWIRVHVRHIHACAHSFSLIFAPGKLSNSLSRKASMKSKVYATRSH